MQPFSARIADRVLLSGSSVLLNIGYSFSSLLALWSLGVASATQPELSILVVSFPPPLVCTGGVCHVIKGISKLRFLIVCCIGMEMTIKSNRSCYAIEGLLLIVLVWSLTTNYTCTTYQIVFLIDKTRTEQTMHDLA